MKLTANQSLDLPFPVGCPVWYACAAGPASPTDPPPLKRGVVRAVSFDYATRAMVYSVGYAEGGDAEAGGHMVAEDVAEDRMAFGAGCPVRIASDGKAVDGTVLLCRQSPEDQGKFLYTVMTCNNDGHCNWVEGIDGDKISYRKEMTKCDASVAKGDDRECGIVKEVQPADAAMHNPSFASKRTLHHDEGAKEPALPVVPASITCNSVSKSDDGSSEEEGLITEGLGSGKKRKMWEDNGVHRNVVSSSEGNEETRMVVHIPLWLQNGRNGRHKQEVQRKQQKSLFFHLIGSKREGRRGVQDVGRETNCRIEVNFDPKSRNNGPMTIIIDACSRAAVEDLHAAREEVQGLLLAIVHRIDPGAMGRLLYEVAAGCPGAHRPENSTSRAVEARDPFEGKRRFMSLVEVPYYFDVVGRKQFHVSYVLNTQVFQKIRKHRCYLRVCAEGFKIPVWLCDAYVFVQGDSWQDVDKAVDIVKGAIRGHIAGCGCTLP